MGGDPQDHLEASPNKQILEATFKRQSVLNGESFRGIHRGSFLTAPCWIARNTCCWSGRQRLRRIERRVIVVNILTSSRIISLAIHRAWIASKVAPRTFRLPVNQAVTASWFGNGAAFDSFYLAYYFQFFVFSVGEIWQIGAAQNIAVFICCGCDRSSMNWVKDSIAAWVRFSLINLFTQMKQYRFTTD